MNIPFLLTVLKCIACKSPALEWKSFSPDESCGIFLCTKCGHYYPVEEEVADFLPPDLIAPQERKNFEARFKTSFPPQASLFVPSSTKRPELHQFTFEEDDPGSYDQKVVANAFWEKASSVVWKHWRESFKNVQGPVLDMGCGTGRITQALAADFSEVIGIDPSVPMLRFAAKKARQMGLAQKNSYIAGDLWNLPFREEKFAGVFFFGVLHHLNRPYDALKELLPLLKKGGVLCGSENNVSIFRSIFDFLMRFKPIWEEDAHLEHATISEKSLDAPLREKGFDAAFKTTCFIPPHLYLFLPPALANFLYGFADAVFGFLPFFSKQGGLIYFTAKRNELKD